MSVDVSARFGGPVSLAAICDDSRQALASLLGMRAAPGLMISEGWAARSRSWRPADRGRLGELVTGDPATAAGQAFTFHVAGLEDRAYLSLVELTEDDGSPCGEVDAVVEPDRTCAGVVLAVAVALGVAIASDGTLAIEDWQLPMAGFVPELTGDPGRFIAMARMDQAVPGDSPDLAGRCERFLRRLPGFGTWPADRTVTS